MPIMSAVRAFADFVELHRDQQDRLARVAHLDDLVVDELNGADIDGSRLVWAHDRGAENRELPGEPGAQVEGAAAGRLGAFHGALGGGLLLALDQWCEAHDCRGNDRDNSRQAAR